MQRVSDQRATSPRYTRSRSSSSRELEWFLGALVVLLLIVVAWIGLKHHGTRDSRVGALQHRIAALESSLAGLRRATSEFTRQTSAALDQDAAALKKLSAPATGTGTLPARCAVEVQQEIDDIRGYIAFGGAIKRRVTTDCKPLLAPRFGG